MGRIGIFVFLLAVGAASCQTPGPGPVAAYSSNDSVYIVSKAGEVVSTIRMPIKVGEFSFSPDLKRLVLVTRHPNADESGGKMYLYSLASKHLQRIPRHALRPESAKSEVYSEPQFSADGTRLFFNTHPHAEGDLAETNGPIAEIDLKSLHETVLESTAVLLTDGFRLSPNGGGFLLWDEGKVIDVNGTTLFDFHDFQLDESFKWALDQAWIGNSCVLYRAGKSANSQIAGEIAYFVLDLKTMKSTSALKTLGISDRELDGLAAYRYPYAVVKRSPGSAGKQESGYFLVSPGVLRVKLAPADAMEIQIIANNVTDKSPGECR